jgi:hypothetical protein
MKENLVKIVPGAIGLLLAAATLCACGGSTHGRSSASTARAASSASITDLATKAGCSPFDQDTSNLELYVRESGACTVGAAQVRIYTFNDGAARDQYLAAAKQFGLGAYQQGPAWVVTGDTVAAVQQVAARLS